MIRRELLLRRGKPGLARLAQHDTVVHVVHPDDPTQPLTIPHSTEDAAAATFAKIHAERFPRATWEVTHESDLVDVAGWVARESDAETRSREQQRLSEQGWAKAGSTMAMRIYLEPEHLTAALAHTADATALHVLLDLEDNVGVHRRPMLMRWLARGGAPELVELTFESPELTRDSLEVLPLHVPAELIAGGKLRSLAAVGAGVWPTGVTPHAGLEHLRLISNFVPEDMADIAGAPGLRVLQIQMSKRAEAAARAAFPVADLDELTVEAVADMPAMIHALLDGKVPRVVQLAGRSKPKLLRAAIARWRAEAPTATLRIGPAPIENLEPALGEVLAEAKVEQYVSPFGTSQRPAHLHVLWDPLRRR